MKICFAMSNLGHGGAERVVSILSDEMIKRGNKVFICLTDSNPLIAYDINEEIKIDKIRTGGFAQEILLHNSNKRIEAYLKSINPDVVITMATGVGSIFAPICKKLGKVYIHSERNDVKKINTTYALKMRWSILVRNTNNVIFQTEKAMAPYPTRIQKNATVILNPFDSGKLPAYCEGDRLKEIVSVGRLTTQKRQDILIKSFSKIAEKYPDYVLKIYGSGELEEQYRSLIAELGLDVKVLLMGNTQHILEEINQSALFAFSSDYEGLPNALIEAMALGLPCVSTKCSPGGAEELIQDGINGRLVECDDVEALAAAIDEMLSNYQRSLEMGKEARKIVERLKISTIVDAWETYIKKCIDM